MNRQEYYDLLVQKSQSGAFPSRNESSCLYLSPEGKQCAVGVLIPKEEFHNFSIERLGQGIDDLLVWKPELKQYLPTDMRTDELKSVQHIHDQTAWDSKSDGLLWNHQMFVQRLNKSMVFGYVDQVEVSESEVESCG